MLSTSTKISPLIFELQTYRIFPRYINGLRMTIW
jgi:hypothetical protein